MVRTDEAVIRILEVRLQRDNGLLGHVLDLFHKITYIFAFAHEVLNYGRKQLL